MSGKSQAHYRSRPHEAGHRCYRDKALHSDAEENLMQDAQVPTVAGVLFRLVKNRHDRH
jgi:hypothetical protein